MAVKYRRARASLEVRATLEVRASIHDAGLVARRRGVETEEQSTTSFDENLLNTRPARAGKYEFVNLERSPCGQGRRRG